MLGQLCFLPSGRSRVRRAEVYGLPVLLASLRPTGWWGERRVERALRALQKRGVRTVLLPDGFQRWETLEALGLRPVDPVPLLQAAAGPLALALLARAGIAPTQATVALRGERAGPELRRAAELLCPQVRQLVIDAPRGGTACAAASASPFSPGRRRGTWECFSPPSPPAQTGRRSACLPRRRTWPDCGCLSPAWRTRTGRSSPSWPPCGRRGGCRWIA